MDPADRVMFAVVSDEPASVDACARAVSRDSAGAVVTFAGVVRDHDENRAVTRLSYTSHPDASRVIGQVAADIAAQHPDVVLAVAHRVGDLAIGDIALACAVSSPHRAAAFTACAALVDEVKERLPVWKEQFFADGTSEWVGSA